MKNVNVQSVFGADAQVCNVKATVNVVKHVMFSDGDGEVVDNFYELVINDDAAVSTDDGFKNARTIRVNARVLRAAIHRNAILHHHYDDACDITDEGDVEVDGKTLHWVHTDHLQSLVGCQVSVTQRLIPKGSQFQWDEDDAVKTADKNMVKTAIDNIALDFGILNSRAAFMKATREVMIHNTADFDDAESKTLIAECDLEDIIASGAIVNIPDTYKKIVTKF